MRKKFLLHILFIIFAFVAVWITASQQKVEVLNKDDLRALSCGWPLKFVESDLYYRDPPYPWKISCFEGEWGDFPTFHWPQFIINILLFYALIVFLWSAYVALNNKMQR